MWFSQKWWPWPWTLSDFNKKKFGRSLIDTSYVKKSGRSVQWCGLYIANRRTNMQQTDRQTDRQTDQYRLRFCKVTNRGDQYTLQKSTILQSNERIIGDFTFILILTDFDLWPRPLTLTVIYFCKKKLQKTVMLWRHVTQNGASYIERKTPFRWVFLQGILCSQPEVSTTSG